MVLLLGEESFRVPTVLSFFQSKHKDISSHETSENRTQLVYVGAMTLYSIFHAVGFILSKEEYWLILRELAATGFLRKLRQERCTPKQIKTYAAPTPTEIEVVPDPPSPAGLTRSSSPSDFGEPEVEAVPDPSSPTGLTRLSSPSSSPKSPKQDVTSSEDEKDEKDDVSVPNEEVWEQLSEMALLDADTVPEWHELQASRTVTPKKSRKRTRTVQIQAAPMIEWYWPHPEELSKLVEHGSEGEDVIGRFLNRKQTTLFRFTHDVTAEASWGVVGISMKEINVGDYSGYKTTDAPRKGKLSTPLTAVLDAQRQVSGWVEEIQQLLMLRWTVAAQHLERYGDWPKELSVLLWAYVTDASPSKIAAFVDTWKHDLDSFHVIQTDCKCCG